jgi:hypothetical protein
MAVPLHVYVLRKLWEISAQSTREIMESEIIPEKVVYHSKRKGSTHSRNRSSFGRKRNSINLSDRVYSTDRLAPALRKSSGMTSRDIFPDLSNLNSKNCIYPYVHQNVELLYGEERLSSIKHLVLSARNSIIQIVKHSGPLYITCLCNEITNAGLRDGDWERVKSLLKTGIGLVLKQVFVKIDPIMLNI